MTTNVNFEDLDDLVARDMVTRAQASFLSAAIKAGKSVVVAGPQSAGKTTLTRALCAAIPHDQVIATFETEFELHLHELTDVHDQVIAWEARPGSGKSGPDGRFAGEETVGDAIYDSFRFNVGRQVVGEVRGPEVWAMLKATKAGVPSISTTHAQSAGATMCKLAGCAMTASADITPAVAMAELAEFIDLLVQLDLVRSQTPDGSSTVSRWVSEISAVAPGGSAQDSGGYTLTPIFERAGLGEPVVTGVLPEDFRDLEAWGRDIDARLTHDDADAGTESGDVEDQGDPHEDRP